MKKVILVVLDGIGDLPCPELGGKTPLEAANTPNLNFFAAEGKCGYMYPIKEGIAPESDAALIAILGYNPYKYFTGRGPLEAYGAGIKIKSGDLALRTNFATVKEDKGNKENKEEKEIIDRRVGRTLSTAEAAILAKAINKQVKLQFPFIFKATTEHRGVLVIKGGFSNNITNTDPAYIGGGPFGIAKAQKAGTKLKVQTAKPLDDDEVTSISASVVNSFVGQSYSILKEHPVNKERMKKHLLPANIILTRDAGTELPDFPEKHRGWGAIVALPLEKALAKLCGMKVLKFRYPDVTGHAYKDLYNMLREEIKVAKKYLRKKFKRYDCFYVHLKETDVPGHDGLPLEKKKMIEIIDKEFFSFIKELKEKILLVVTADHSTPCSIRAHSADPVPLLIYGKGKDSVKVFSEKACRHGSLGKIYGENLLRIL